MTENAQPTSQPSESQPSESQPSDLPDFRAPLLAAEEWVAGLMAKVTPAQYEQPTPCSEYDVEALLKHLYGVADRVIAAGEGRDPVSVPLYADPLPADVAAGFSERVQRACTAWADEAALSKLLEAPWGRAPAAVVAGVYLAENVTHGWDLAVATGQPSEADPQLAGIGLQVMSRALPAAGREGFPFDEPVASAADAGPTERLANWMGRTRWRDGRIE